MRFGFGRRRVRAMLVVLIGFTPIVPTVLVVGGQAGQSGAMNMGPDQCALNQIAFCDTFQTNVGGGREGDLDPAKWSFTRVTQQNNPSQGLINNYWPVEGGVLQDHQGRGAADNDSFICGARVRRVEPLDGIDRRPAASTS